MPKKKDQAYASVCNLLYSPGPPILNKKKKIKSTSLGVQKICCFTMKSRRCVAQIRICPVCRHRCDGRVWRNPLRSVRRHNIYGHTMSGKTLLCLKDPVVVGVLSQGRETSDSDYWKNNKILFLRKPAWRFVRAVFFIVGKLDGFKPTP